MKDSERLPVIDQELVDYLTKMFPPLEYKVGDHIDSFKIDAVYRAGQRDLIQRLALLKQQQERRR